MSRTWDGWKGN